MTSDRLYPPELSERRRGFLLALILAFFSRLSLDWTQRRRWIQLDCPSYPYNSVSAGGSHTWSDRLHSPQLSPTLGPRRRWDPERRRTAWWDVSAWLGSVRGVWCQDLWAELQWSRPERWFRLTILLYADVRSRRTSSLRTSSALTDTDTRATSVILSRRKLILVFMQSIVDSISTLIIYIKFSISNKCCSFHLSKNPEKNLMFHGKKKKKWSSTTVFNIDNNQKCFLSSKSAYVTLDHKTSHKGQFFKI